MLEQMFKVKMKKKKYDNDNKTNTKMKKKNKIKDEFSEWSHNKDLLGDDFFIFTHSHLLAW